MSTPKGPSLAVLPMADNEGPVKDPQILQPSGWPAPNSSPANVGVSMLAAEPPEPCNTSTG